MKQSLLAFILLISFQVTLGQCPDGDIIFTSQAEIDAFPINFPDCTMITFPNDVTISGDDIVDLTSLSQIIFIDNNLTINDNPQLVSLEGLNNINDIVGNLIVSNNPTLSSLNGLGAFGFTSVQIINNDALTNLEGAEELIESFFLVIEDNDLLENLLGLSNYVYGGQNIIKNNVNLSSLDGLEALITVETLLVEDNPSLIDISSLENLQEIVTSFEVINNDLLTSLDGLQNAGATFDFASGFRISDNGALEDISALSDYETPSQFIEITNNPNLSDCVNPFLCANTSNAILIVNNNSQNCNSAEEVEDACILGVNEELRKSILTIYPNPIVDILNIAFASDIQLQRIDVFSATGKKIVTTQETSIDFSSLTRGVYFVRIQTNEGTITKKIVKK